MNRGHMLEAGVVHQDVDVEVELGQAVEIGQVDHQRLAVDLGRYGPGSLGVDIEHHDRGVRRGEAGGTRSSDPTARTGHESPTPGEIEGGGRRRSCA